MIIVKYIMMFFIAFGGGAVISGAVFAIISSTGVVTRMADKTHTAAFIKSYETAIILGGIWWNSFWIFSLNIPMPMNVAQGLQMIMGFCQGVFVGCIAISLAEALNATAIFSRRAKLKNGLSFIILSVALGKVIATLIQFANNWVKK